MERCVLCKNDGGKLSTVYDKGLKSLLRVCREKDKEKLHEELTKLKRQEERIFVHPECRKSFLDCRKNEKEVRQLKRLISADCSFDWKKLCFLCGDEVDTKRSKDLFRHVSTIEFHKSLVKISNERNDEWGKMCCSDWSRVSTWSLPKLFTTVIVPLRFARRRITRTGDDPLIQRCLTLLKRCVNG